MENFIVCAALHVIKIVSVAKVCMKHHTFISIKVPVYRKLQRSIMITK